MGGGVLQDARFSVFGKGRLAAKGLPSALSLLLSLSAHAVGPGGPGGPSRAAEPALDAGALAGIVRDGDVILRLGDRLWSRMFMDVSPTDRRYSHLGVARVAGGRATVIHAEGAAAHGVDGVREDALEEFVSVAKAVGVYRARGVDGGLISAAAAECLGVPFDWRFDMDDGSSLYCTELLYVALRRAAPGLELATVGVGSQGKRVIPLEAVSASEHFEEVRYAAAPSP
jgi:hypothetical protein